MIFPLVNALFFSFMLQSWFYLVITDISYHVFLVPSWFWRRKHHRSIKRGLARP